MTRAIINLTILLNVPDDLDLDVQAVALATRQQTWMNISDVLTANGLAADELADVFVWFEPTVSYAVDMGAA